MQLLLSERVMVHPIVNRWFDCQSKLDLPVKRFRPSRTKVNSASGTCEVLTQLTCGEVSIVWLVLEKF